MYSTIDLVIIELILVYFGILLDTLKLKINTMKLRATASAAVNILLPRCM